MSENIALGMIETKGLVGAVEASDAMVKAAERYFNWQGIGRRRSCYRNGKRRCRRG